MAGEAVPGNREGRAGGRGAGRGGRATGGNGERSGFTAEDGTGQPGRQSAKADRPPKRKLRRAMTLVETQANARRSIGGGSPPVGRYSATQLVDYINTTCNATPAFTTGHAVPPDPVPLTIVAGQVSWKIGDNVLQPCSALTIFCVSGYFTGNFSTNIFLANPWALSLHSPSLVGTTRFVCANPNRITAPFYVHQIQSAFGDVESSESSIALQYSTPLSHANLQQLDVLVLDPFSNRELVELSSWSCLLEVLV